MSNFTEHLRAAQLLANMAGDESVSYPLPEAQRDDLLSRVHPLLIGHADGAPIVFRRLDFVKFHEGLGCFTAEFEKSTQFMFWSYISPNDDVVKARMTRMPGLVAYPSIDCMICYLEAGALMFDLAWSPMLKLGKL